MNHHKVEKLKDRLRHAFATQPCMVIDILRAKKTMPLPPRH